MSTIEAKGSRPSDRPGPVSRETFEAEDERKPSRLPLLFGLAITALVAYLKSALPIFGVGEADGPGLAPEQGKAEPTEQGQAVEPVEEKEEKPQNTIHLVHPFPDTGLDLPAIVDYRFRASVGEDSFSFRATPFSLVNIPAFSRALANDNTPSPSARAQDLSDTGLPDGEPAAEADGQEDPQTPGTSGADRKNRAPVSSGGVRLTEVMAGQAVLIGLSELLANLEDPDGDVMSVRNVRVSAGSIGQSPDGWVFSSNRQTADQDVTVTYEVTDGEATVTRTALLRIEGKVPIVGTDGGDLLAGLDSDDQIDAGGGDDIINGKGGDDHIRGGSGNDYIMGGAGNDRIDAGAGNDVVFAGAGDDTVSGGDGDDRLYGEAGDDILYGGEGADSIQGGDGNDIIDGGEGHDHLSGGRGNDVIQAGPGNDRVFGGDGDDLIEDGTGADTVEAGAGDDIMLVVPDREIDSYDGGTGFDTIDLTRTAEDMQLNFSMGTIRGPGTGSDFMAGVEALILGTGNDTVVDGQGSQSVVLGAGDDVLIAALDGVDDCFVGGEGRDTLDLSSTTQGVFVNPTAGTSTGSELGSDSAVGFEVVVGGSGDDCIVVDTTLTTVAVRLAGGHGEDRFQFDISSGSAASSVQLIHQIFDFMVGDQVYVADYEFRKIRGDDGAEKFERIYESGGAGLDDDEFLIRLRDATTGEVKYAVIEVDSDRDERIDFSVEIYGALLPVHDPVTA